MRAQTRRHVEQVAGAVAAVAATAIAFSVLAGVLSDGEWPWVVATYLRLPQVLVITVATVVLFVAHWWRTATVSAIVAAGLIVSVAAPLRALTTVPALRGGTVRIAVFNTGARDADITAVAQTIAAARPDVAVLFESEDIAETLDARLDGLTRLPTPIDTPVTSPPIVFARQDWPLTMEPLGGARPATIVTVNVGGQPLDIVAAHPLPPVTRRWARSHDQSITALTTEVLPRRNPFVLACDCNTTPWSPSMARLLDTGLRGPTVGATFAAPVIGIPLDHILLSDRVDAVTRDLGPFAGSDHRLIVTEVAVEPKQPRSQASRR